MSGHPEERFWAMVDKGDSCWLWTGGARDGYGVFRVGRRKVQAHRFAYETLVGPIPDGLHIDHLCRRPRCVNPAHLEPVTCRENLARGASRTFKAHLAGTCVKGHDAATHAYRRKSNGEVAYCRACRRERKEAARAR